MNKKQRRDRIRNIKKALENRKRKKRGLGPRQRRLFKQEVIVNEPN